MYTIAITGNAIDFGDLIQKRQEDQWNDWFSDKMVIWWW